MALKRLSPDLQCILSSSLQINNFKRVVEELVYNSLDAKATSIAVRVDVEENKIQVVDNGCGITENDFDLLGQKYSTSKCVDLNTLKSAPNTYGYRGQFLANLINIAQKVKITSRFQNSKDTWVKIFYNGKERDIAKTTNRPSIGTTVEVSNLFYNLHIQNKNVGRLYELNEIKTLLKQLSLIHSSISLSLRDDSKNEIVFKAHKNRSIYQTFGLLFNIDESNIQELKVEKKEYKVAAYFGKRDKDLAQYHWIYLNGKIVHNSKLHKIVNENLGKSLKPRIKRKIKTKVDDDEDVISKSNIPFYIILLSCPYYDYDISESSKHTTLEFKNWQEINKLLKKLIMFYTGDESLNMQLKPETTTKNVLKPKLFEDDTREQVRKIVEKLLKSNSKKLGVSQMLNGVKGKLTKRKKKMNSLKLSIVIPSKNKVLRQTFKENRKKNYAGDANLAGAQVPELLPSENMRTDHKNQIEAQGMQENGTENIAKYNFKVEEKSKKINKETFKKSNSKQMLKGSVQKTNLHDRKKQKKVKNNRNKFKDNFILTNPYNYYKKENNIDHNYLQDSLESLKTTKIKRKLEMLNDVYRNNYDEESTNNQQYKKLKYPKIEKDITSFCNFTNNTNIKLREKIQQIIVYDYAPHPLKSIEGLNFSQNRLNTKSHFSSRDLVQTILNTQHNISSTKNNYICREIVYKPQQSETCENIQNISALGPKKRRSLTKIYDKTTQNTTFDSCNLNFDANFHNKEHLFLSKMTYESHNYKRNVHDDEIYKTMISKTKQFVTKQSKDNFLFSAEKHIVKKSKSENKTEINQPDINLPLGLKNLFKNRHFLQESSFMIEFSNSTKKNISCQTKHLRKNNQNSNRTKYSKGTEECTQENSAKALYKHTYTMSESILGTKSDCNVRAQNYECIKFTNYVLQNTYTIETNNETFSLNWPGNSYQAHEKKHTIADDDDLKIVFVSEPQTSAVETSSDKIIEPINMCETILSGNVSENQINKSLANTDNYLNKLCPNTEIYNNSPKVILQEVSHHFNNTIDNTNIRTKLSNTSQIASKTDNKKENDNNNKINNVFTKPIDEKTQLIDAIKIPSQNSPNDDCSKPIQSFNIQNRPRFMPKGMSQIFKNCNTKEICNYSLDEEYYKCNIYEDFNNEIEINTEIFKPRIHNTTDDTSKAIEKVQTKLQKENSSLTFNGQLLKQAQVLGQVDSKFIAAVVNSKSENTDFLVLFDQHAVHERIRLEMNLADYINETEWKSVKLDDFLIKLSEDEVLYLHNYKEKFTQLGLEWNILSNCEVSVFGIPEAILGKNPRQVDRVITAVKSLILEEICTIKTQGGCISLHPKSIMDLVFSEACRYAIKFGDKLSIMECRDLIKSLAECRTPFQCAHGRPVMAVLMEMSSRDVQDYKVDISKIRGFSLKTKNKAEKYF